MFHTLIRPVCLSCVLLMMSSAPAQAGWFDFFGRVKTVAGSGRLQKQSKNLDAFNEVDISLPAQIELRQGDSEHAEIEADDNLLSLIEVAVDHGTLQIRPALKNSIPYSKQLRITVYLKNLAELRISGWGKVHADHLQTPGLHVAISGSGNVKLPELRAEALDIDIGGSGHFEASGAVPVIHGKIGGSSALQMGRLEASDVSLRIGGSGYVQTWAKNRLDVTIGGSGEVQYYGEPKISKAIGGSGKLQSLGAAPQ